MSNNNIYLSFYGYNITLETTFQCAQKHLSLKEKSNLYLDTNTSDDIFTSLSNEHQYYRCKNDVMVEWSCQAVDSCMCFISNITNDCDYTFITSPRFTFYCIFYPHLLQFIINKNIKIIKKTQTWSRVGTYETFKG